MDYIEREKQIMLTFQQTIEEVIENVKNGKEYSKGEIFMLSHNFIKDCDIKTLLNNSFLYEETLNNKTN